MTDNFDAEFYRNIHEDLKHMSIEEATNHYYNYGKKENRFINKSQVEFYRDIHYDLKHMSIEEAIKHYHTYGMYEKRLFSKKHFYDLYPEFDIDIDIDIDFYKLFNTNNDLSYEQILNHYSYSNIINNKYFEVDFIVNNDYTISNVNDTIKDKIQNQYMFRYIDTYDKLVNYRKQYEKEYIIITKNDFYNYYKFFDYEFYKNKYFNDTHMTENEILLYYHTKGKYENHITNNKKDIIIYSPAYDNKCGGLVIIHYFCKLINEKYNDKYRAKLFMNNNIKYLNPFCNNFANTDEINDNTIVIYPETVTGNPLNAKNVIRWILLELGIEMPLDHYNNWNRTDLIYHWENIDKQLSCPFFNNIFTNKNLQERTKTCFLIKKGRLIHEQINYIHNSNSINIEELSLEEIANLFNECKYFYCYDPNTAYIIYATVCGCIPIIHEIQNVNEEEYFKNKMFNFNNTIYNRGIVYGNNIDKINYILENKLNKNNEEYYKNLFNMIQEKTIPLFLNDIENL